MTGPVFGELLGTLVLVYLGDSVVANVLLNKSKGQNSGWIVITTGCVITSYSIHYTKLYEGWETLCKCQTNTGYTVDGTFAEYALADADYAIPIPEGANLVEIAPILCAGVTVYNALKRTEARKGDWVAISGVITSYSIHYTKLYDHLREIQKRG